MRQVHEFPKTCVNDNDNQKIRQTEPHLLHFAQMNSKSKI